MQHITGKNTHLSFCVPLLVFVTITEFTRIALLVDDQTSKRNAFAVKWFFVESLSIALLLQAFGVVIEAPTRRGIRPITGR